MSTYWQVAAGSEGREYSEQFLTYGIACVGGKSNVDTMSEVEEGDVVILKSGMSEILAAGAVVARNGQHRGCSDKDWLNDFDGWELPAWCYVDWHKARGPVKVAGLTRTTIERTHRAEHRRVADELMGTPRLPRDPEPARTEQLNDGDILRALIAEGLRPGSAEELTNTLARIRLLAEYYRDRDWKDVREHETRTFLVVPLLLALGWAEQQVKIEFPSGAGRIDLALFLPRYDKDVSKCVVLIETKDFKSGLDYAKNQVRVYATHFPSCKVLVVTNGYCYKTYARTSGGDFAKSPSAYLNVLRPTSAYPLDPKGTGGALDVLRSLLPMASR